MREKLKQGGIRFVQLLMEGLVILLFHPKVEYISEKAREENFRGAPRVLICNHIRSWDGAILYTMLMHGRAFKALTALDLQEKSAFLRFLMRFIPNIRVDREHASLSWLRESRKAVKDGCHIMIFPEGYCNRARVIRDFKPGVCMISAMTEAPVVPVYLNGEYTPFFSFGKKRCRLMVGEAVTLQKAPEGVDADVMAEEAVMLRERVLELEKALNGSIRE